MYKILVALLTILIVTPAFAAEGFSSLEEQMTGREFTAAGLNKLSQEELDALNEWIRAHSLGTLDTPKAAAASAATTVTSASTQAETAEGDRRGLASDDSEDDSPIRSKILGEFDGWDGQTIFKLENGMIWVQDDRDKFYVKDIEDPIAVIEPGMFNSWHLHIEGHKSKCKVKRIQ